MARAPASKPTPRAKPAKKTARKAPAKPAPRKTPAKQQARKRVARAAPPMAWEEPQSAPSAAQLPPPPLEPMHEEHLEFEAVASPKPAAALPHVLPSAAPPSSPAPPAAPEIQAASQHATLAARDLVARTERDVRRRRERDERQRQKQERAAAKARAKAQRREAKAQAKAERRRAKAVRRDQKRLLREQAERARGPHVVGSPRASLEPDHVMPARPGAQAPEPSRWGRGAGVRLRCPKCGHGNERDAIACSSCRALL